MNRYCTFLLLLLIFLSASACSVSENDFHQYYLAETSSSSDISKHFFFYPEESPDVDDFPLTTTISDSFTDLSVQEIFVVFRNVNGLSPEPDYSPPENL